jgi:hypothetical protein
MIVLTDRSMGRAGGGSRARKETAATAGEEVGRGGADTAGGVEERSWFAGGEMRRLCTVELLWYHIIWHLAHHTRRRGALGLVTRDQEKEALIFGSWSLCLRRLRPWFGPGYYSTPERHESLGF